MRDLVQVRYTDFLQWQDRVDVLYPNRPYVGQRMRSVFDTRRPVGDREVARWSGSEGWIREPGTE